GWHGSRDGTQGGGGRNGNRGPMPGRPPMTATGPQECKQNDKDACCTCKQGGAVMLQSGEERFDRTDFLIPGRGDMNFEIHRWYRSRLDYNGPLGYGWDFNYNEGLYFQPNGNIVRNDGGAHLDTWTRNPDGTFAAPLGQFRVLVQQADGTYALRDPDGSRRC